MPRLPTGLRRFWKITPKLATSRFPRRTLAAQTRYLSRIFASRRCDQPSVVPGRAMAVSHRSDVQIKSLYGQSRRFWRVRVNGRPSTDGPRTPPSSSRLVRMHADGTWHASSTTDRCFACSASLNVTFLSTLLQTTVIGRDYITSCTLIMRTSC